MSWRSGREILHTMRLWGLRTWKSMECMAKTFVDTIDCGGRNAAGKLSKKSSANVALLIDIKPGCQNSVLELIFLFFLLWWPWHEKCSWRTSCTWAETIRLRLNEADTMSLELQLLKSMCEMELIQELRLGPSDFKWLSRFQSRCIKKRLDYPVGAHWFWSKVWKQANGERISQGRNRLGKVFQGKLVKSFECRFCKTCSAKCQGDTGVLFLIGEEGKRDILKVLEAKP